MSDAPDNDQKTESPTPKRLQDAREKGDILQSKELGAALVMMAGAGWLMTAGGWLVASTQDMLIDGLSFDHGVVENFDPGSAIARLTMPIVAPVAALFAMTFLAAIAGPVLLGSGGFRWEAMNFKGDRINPAAGLKRIFGTQGLVELGKSMAKIALMGAVGWWLFSGRMKAMTTLTAPDLRTAITEIGGTFTFAVVVMSVALGAIAGIDVPMQAIRRAGRLRMTKQEIKDEHKQSEGSPELKGHIRRKQAEILQSSTRGAIADANVVLVNPTHFAVALRYRPGFDAAPIVVARGRGEMAQAIRDFADEKAVPVLRYPQLARAIYFTSRAGHLVREDLYIAVATVLAFVFNLDRAMADGISQPEVIVPADARYDADGKKE
ncbi:flagellar type III secretion system protein FlhB [Sphingomonas naphthae]|uniref:Flagellar type III secretion system protein FlhB n=1 Tax=Sphingomonas naphthae TaxID=1813468 RepID=A0ABY7TJF7_9SPHN|nr:flagellar type III secretion system protein FlhB [Sphingomonas naphthae]WCT72911.1 flagellar type III secretion system protein FlhB [Sphingomonas naphthae]